MSELTSCNYCDLQWMKRRYGAENVRVVLSRTSTLGGVEVQVRRDGQWPAEGADPEVWFMQLTAHCVC